MDILESNCPDIAALLRDFIESMRGCGVPTDVLANHAADLREWAESNMRASEGLSAA